MIHTSVPAATSRPATYEQRGKWPLSLKFHDWVTS